MERNVRVPARRGAGALKGLIFASDTLRNNSAIGSDEGAPSINVINATPNQFSPGPTAYVTGDPEVGRTLTAEEGAPSPEPDTFAYQWLADNEPIDGATGETFEVASTQIGKRISVTVTAKKAGYEDAFDTSAQTAVVATPSVPLTVSTPEDLVMRGSSFRVNASGLARREAYTIMLGDTTLKKGLATYSGTVATYLRVPGTVVEGDAVLRVTSAAGRTGLVDLYVVTPKTFTVKLDPTSAPRNNTVELTVTGMAPSERVRVNYSGRWISPSTATANDDGTYTQSIHVGTGLGRRTLTVRGQFSGRSGKGTITVTP